MNVLEPIKNYFFICCSLVCFLDGRRVGFQKQVFWKPVYLMGVLKVRPLNFRFKFFAPQREVGSWVFSMIIWGYTSSRIYGKGVSDSELFQCRYFLICSMCKCHSFSGSLFRENCSLCSWTFSVSAGGQGVQDPLILSSLLTPWGKIISS